LDILKLFDSFETVSIGRLSLATLLSAVLVFLVCLIAIKILSRVASRLLKRSKMDNSLKSFIRSALKISLWALAIIIVADSLGIPTASLVAILSVAGLALSLSLQDIMSNLFSGVTILATKPFTSGDFVELGGLTGTVRDVGLFYTKIITLDNKLVFIPNKDVVAAKILNYSSQPERRVEINVKTSYDSPTGEVKSALLQAALRHPKVLREPAPQVHLVSFGEGSLEFSLRAWVKNADHWEVFCALNEDIRSIFEEKGIKLSYNNMNVRIINND
jgi:small conductance mechanosensitive channel